jgi:hypothetical protein
MRIGWRTVGDIIERTMSRRRDPDLLDGLEHIGIDELSYRRHHEYVTVRYAGHGRLARLSPHEHLFPGSACSTDREDLMPWPKGLAPMTSTAKSSRICHMAKIRTQVAVGNFVVLREDGVGWAPDGICYPVVSAKLSLKFCHKFAEIRSLNLHA